MGLLRGKKGFTLLEVLAAMAVLAVALVVLLQTDGLNAERALNAKRLMGAVQVARERMEETFSRGGSGVATQEDGQTEGPFTWSRVVSDTQFTGVKEIRVTVTWKEGDREQSYSILSYLPD